MSSSTSQASSTPYLTSVLASLTQLSSSSLPTLYRTSDALLSSFRQALQHSKSPNMLPSYTSNLPLGTESGTAIALDLGGSTLRVAVIHLRPHSRLEGPDLPHLPSVRTTLARQSWIVSDSVKTLPAADFFDWIATRIATVMAEASLTLHSELVLGVTWSFPVTPMSSATGRVQQMGKGYTQWREIQDTDLRAHFEAALNRRGLTGLRMTCLMNDTEATLLSHAYANPATRISLIWGTGLNAAVYLPIAAVGGSKLQHRARDWLSQAQATVVNTEVSMFGGNGTVPLLQADRELDSASPMPGFQPLEQMTSGRYLGEIVRRVLVGAIKANELFQGKMPQGMERGYSLDTAVVSAFEEDSHSGEKMLRETYGFEAGGDFTYRDRAYIVAVCEAVAARAAVLLAVTVFSLYRLQRDAHPPQKLSAALMERHIVGENAPVAVAYCGAVAEKHFSARWKCQEVLDRLVEEEDPRERNGAGKRRLVLEGAADSGLLGAAVGAVMNDRSKKMRAKL